LETNKQKERRAIEHIMELLRKLLEKCECKKINEPKDDLFLESNWIRDKRRRVPTKYVRRGREAVDGCAEGRRLRC